MIKNDSFTIRLNAQNMISIFENDIEAEPTADELSAAVQAALVQYRAAEA